MEDKRREPLGQRRDLTQQGCDRTKKGNGKLKQFGIGKLFPCVTAVFHLIINVVQLF